MYIKKTYHTGKIIEVEKVCTFRYKGKRVKRGPVVQKTPEYMAKINERNAEKKLRRTINLNFDENAYHLVLTYDPLKRAANPAGARDDIAKFWRTLKARCKKAGTVLKYVCVSEYGQRSMHHHAVVDCGLDLKVIQECWPHGRVHSTNLDDSGDYGRLASYLIKQTNKTYNDPERCVHKKRFCCSKNLIQPEAKIEIIKADSWREEPVAPKGYAVVKDSVVAGVSDISGWPFQYYSLIKLEECNKKPRTKVARKVTPC